MLIKIKKLVGEKSSRNQWDGEGKFIKENNFMFDLLDCSQPFALFEPVIDSNFSDFLMSPLQIRLCTKNIYFSALEKLCPEF